MKVDMEKVVKEKEKKVNTGTSTIEIGSTN